MLILRLNGSVRCDAMRCDAMRCACGGGMGSGRLRTLPARDVSPCQDEGEAHIRTLVALLGSDRTTNSMRVITVLNSVGALARTGPVLSQKLLPAVLKYSLCCIPARPCMQTHAFRIGSGYVRSTMRGRYVWCSMVRYASAASKSSCDRHAIVYTSCHTSAVGML